MKLGVLSEGIIDKSVDQLKEVLKRKYLFLQDVDALLKHIVKGCNSTNLLLDNDKWWKVLASLLQPIDEKDIDSSMLRANNDLSEILKDPIRRQTLINELQIEGVFSSIFGLLKKIVFFLVKAASAGVAAGLSLAGGGGHGSGYGYTGRGNGNELLKQKMLIAGANVKLMELFFTNLDPAAKVASEAVLQQKQQSQKQPKQEEEQPQTTPQPSTSLTPSTSYKPTNW